MHVRSFTKLTGEGTTLLGSNCVDIIERVLPATFGGSSGDYQLVEAEDERHLTRLFVLVSPRLGPVDEQTVVRRFLEALQETAHRPLGGRRPIWEQANSIRVIRQDPIPTVTGKPIIFMGPNLLEHNRSLGVRFLIAYLRGLRVYSMGPTARNVATVAEYTGVPHQVIRNSGWIGIHVDGYVDVGRLRRYQDWLYDIGLVSVRSPIATVVDGALLEQARTYLGIPQR